MRDEGPAWVRMTFKDFESADEGDGTCKPAAVTIVGSYPYGAWLCEFVSVPVGGFVRANHHKHRRHHQHHNNQMRLRTMRGSTRFMQQRIGDGS